MPILNSQNIVCLFGDIQVPLFMVTQNEAYDTKDRGHKLGEATCTSPPLNKPGVVEPPLACAYLEHLHMCRPFK